MPKTLLLADDSITIQKVVGITFAAEDYQVTAVDNGEDALAKARELKPDIILADVVMPRKNGYELCEAVKADPSLQRIPVVLLAGTFEAFDENRARAARADGHIAKPFESGALIAKVKELVEGLKPAAQPAARPAAPARPAGAPPPAAQPVPAQAARPAAGPGAPRPMPGAPPAGARPMPGMPPAGAPPGARPMPGMPPAGAPPGARPMPGAMPPAGPPPGFRPPMPGAMSPAGTRPTGTMPGMRPPGPGMPQPGMAPRPGMQPAAPPGARPPMPGVMPPGAPPAARPPMPGAMPPTSAPVRPTPAPFPARPMPHPAAAPPAAAPQARPAAPPAPAARPAAPPAPPPAPEPRARESFGFDLGPTPAGPSEEVETDFGDLGFGEKIPAAPSAAAPPAPPPPAPPAAAAIRGGIPKEIALEEDVTSPVAAAAPAPFELGPEQPAEVELAPMHAFVPPPAATGHQPEAAAPAGDGGEAALRAALGKASLEVIERVVWEVVPQLAETIIRENLERLTKERQGS